MKRISIVLISFVLILFLLLVGGTMPYFLFYVFILTLLIPLFHCLIVFNNIEGSVEIPEDFIYVGDKITIGFQVNNRSKLSIPYLEIKNIVSKKLTGEELPGIVTTLQPKGSFSHKDDYVIKRRGYYEIGEIEVIVRDIFGFYSFKKTIASKAFLIVYPEPIHITSFRITTIEQLGEMLVDDKAFQDKSRVSSIRDFREGDSVKSIHWKLSAKLDELIVKEFDNSGDTHVVVFIDNYHKLYQHDYDRRLEDKIADIGLSIINYYLNQGIPVTFQTQDKGNLVEIQGNQRSDIKPFLEAFARFKGNGEIKFNSFLEGRMSSIKKDSTVIIVTPNLDKTIGTLGILLRSSSLKPIFIVATYKEINLGSMDFMVEKGLREEGVPVYVLDYKTNIKEALEGK